MPPSKRLDAMTIDERFGRLTERHEALTMNLKLLTGDVQCLTTGARTQDRRTAGRREHPRPRTHRPGELEKADAVFGFAEKCVWPLFPRTFLRNPYPGLATTREIVQDNLRQLHCN